MKSMDLSQLSNEALLGKVEALAQTERFNLINLIVHLGELDDRTACEDRGFPTTFAYLTRRLGYAESDALRRVRTARAARQYPSILRMLASGELNLVSVSLIQPFLTSENHERLLRRTARRSTREVERMVAELSPPEAEPRDRIRALPAPVASAPEPNPSAGALPMFDPMPEPAPVAAGMTVPQSSPKPAPELGPSASSRVVFTFAASEEVRSWFEQARDLLRHRFPMGRMEEVIGEALRRLVHDDIPAGPSRRPRASSPDGRHIPKWVRDEVWRRDSGRCAFVSADGWRCGETAWLEFDHIVPFALGGPSNDPANIRLLCRSHNQSERLRLLGAPGRAGPGGQRFSSPEGGGDISRSQPP
ncbi:MAG: hypothetical protein HY926_14565 [Elusimicrobia bacterium]|nr:hypothetical protein [Elusimicrobiota bacterium]